MTFTLNITLWKLYTILSFSYPLFPKDLSTLKSQFFLFVIFVKWDFTFCQLLLIPVDLSGRIIYLSPLQFDTS